MTSAAPYYADDTLTLLTGDAAEQLRTLPDGAVDCVVTSPPYFGLRDYGGHADEIGTEDTPAAYIARLVDVFGEIRRVLADDGTVWLNLGDSYSSKPGPNNHQFGSKGAKRQALGGDRIPRDTGIVPKNMLGIPWRVALALQGDGWILRNAIIWHKPNAMPESVRDRLSGRYEHLFMLTKSRRYWFDLDAIRKPYAESVLNSKPGKRSSYDAPGQSSNLRNVPPLGKGANPGDVWSINTRPFAAAHFATFPPELPRRCIAAGCKPGGVVLDPFSGAGTTALAALGLGRRAIGIDLNPEYHDIALRRIKDSAA